MASSVEIQISKHEIINLDVSHVRDILNRFTLTENYRNKVNLSVLGYNDDERELFLINDVRLWFHKFFDKVPELLFWMDMNPPWITFYGLMFSIPVKVEGGTILTTDNLEKFLKWGYDNLNSFCNVNKVSPEPTDKHIREALNKMQFTNY